MDDVPLNLKKLIVLAPQRCGGTSITNFLGSLLANSTVFHEPTNGTRPLAAARKIFLETHDAHAFQNECRILLSKSNIVKFCWSNSDTQVTNNFITAAKELGFSFLVLERLNECARQKSKILAQMTKMWGTRGAKYSEIRSKIARHEFIAKSIKEDKLIEEIRKFAERRNQLYEFLYCENVQFKTLFFEEFFRDHEATKNRASELLDLFEQDIPSPTVEIEALLKHNPPIRHNTAISLIPNYSLACCRIDMLMKSHAMEID